jgi:ankyrin repeat protein
MKIAEAETASCGFVIEDVTKLKVWILPGNHSGVIAAVDAGAFSLDDAEKLHVLVWTSFYSYRIPWLLYVASRGWLDLLDRAIQRNESLLTLETSEMHLYETRYSSYTEASRPGDTDPGNLLYSATLYGQVGIVKYLLAKGASATSDMRRANYLHNLFKFEDEDIPELANLLVANGADLNMRETSITGEFWFNSMFVDFAGPPLIPNTWFGNEIAVRTLLQFGADPLLRTHGAGDYVGYNALELAVSLHLYGIVDLMLENVASCGLGDRPEVKSVICHLAGRIQTGKGITHRWVLHGPDYVAACRKTIDVCLKHGCSFDLQFEVGSIPVSETVAMNPCQRYVLEALLDAGADPNTPDRWGRTALMYATRPTWSQGDNAKATRILLDHSATTDTIDNDGRTAMHSHALGNSYLSLEVLLDAGANIEAKDKEGETPLCCTAYTPLGTEALRILLDRGADMGLRSERTPLALAVSAGNLDGMRLLLDRGASVHHLTYGTVLSVAIQAFRINILRVLLHEYRHLFDADALNGRNSPDRQFIPLQLATKSIVCLELLLDSGAEIDARNNSPLSLIRRTALSTAISLGHLDAAVFLLERGATPFCRGDPLERKWTFLHDLAAFRSQPFPPSEPFQFLRTSRRWIMNDDLLGIRNPAGHTPLESAVHHGLLPVVRALVDFGAPIDGLMEMFPVSTSQGTKKRFLRGLAETVNRLHSLDLLSYAKMLRNLTPHQQAQSGGHQDVSAEEMDEIIEYLRRQPFLAKREMDLMEGGRLRRWQLDLIAKQLFGKP